MRGGSGAGARRARTRGGLDELVTLPVELLRADRKLESAGPV
ncbi:hypothetical protein ABZ749_34845 [Micromonospora sp. NPDC047753]